ncbi:MAG: hypothetical protein GC159_03950 [Phycisphaera sp.]|nr:hypothetical protein [Phycisphaera sp.]
MHLTLDIVVRLLHILAAIGLLGGVLFMVVGLLPASKLVEDDEARASLLLTAKKKYYKVSHLAIVLLLATGVMQWMHNHDAYEAGNKKLIAALLGTKVLLALIAFSIAFADTFKVIKGPKWAKINIVLGVTIVILAAVVRHLRLEALTG